jgi:transcriptional regulator of aromatic amino acid metabolism
MGTIRNDADARFLALIKSTEEPIWSVDLNSQLTAFNRAFAQLVEHKALQNLKLG